MTEMSEEQVVDMEQTIARARKMKAFAESPGWKDILLPYLQGGQTGAIKSFQQAATLDEFISARQAFNTLRAIETFVTGSIAAGEAAAEALRKQPDEEV